MDERVARIRARYLDVMERILCNTVYRDDGIVPTGGRQPFDAALRSDGQDWPEHAFTMIGVQRLHQLRRCVEDVLRDGVPGDLIEAGVWRGGAGIMMRAVLAAYEAGERRVWLADSFRGVPAPNPDRYPHDAGLHFEVYDALAVPLDEVKANFARFDLLDERVRFVEGWFSETLAEIEAPAFAVLRLDGDLYESTSDALNALYPRLSPGGYAIVDDYGAIDACRIAVEEYRARHGIVEPLERIDWTGAFWRKAG